MSIGKTQLPDLSFLTSRAIRVEVLQTLMQLYFDLQRHLLTDGLQEVGVPPDDNTGD